jgi:Sigma-70, region 4
MTLKAPRLIENRAAARSALVDFYQPYEIEMGVDVSLARLFIDPPGLQTRYESMVTPKESEELEKSKGLEKSEELANWLMDSAYSAIAFGKQYLPEPIDFLRRQGLFGKVKELFSEDVNIKIVRGLCRRRGRTVTWIAGNLDEILETTVVELITSHLLPQTNRRETNDYETFLRVWKDSYSLPAPQARLARLQLIERAADNRIRRMITAEEHVISVGGNETLELHAAIHDQLVARPELTLRDWIDNNKRLTPDECRVLVLRLVECRTFREIGELMGISTSAVHRLYESAIRKLGDNLE